MEDLAQFKANTHSQFGEDGVLKEIFRRFRSEGVVLNQWCCEFGAWDGLHLSNTARFILEEGFSAVLIEGDPKRVRDLEVNFPESSVIKISSFVTPEGNESLERTLSGTEIPADFDLLSIDIDGMDYYILASLKDYKPKVICVEFNPSVPNSVRFVQEKDPSLKHGASALAITELAEKLGYVAVAATFCNLILVRSDLSQYVSSAKWGLDELIPHGKEGTYIFSGYDGTLLSNSPSINLIWHSLTIPISEFQIIPKMLRKYRGDFSFVDNVLWLLFVVLRTILNSPGTLFKKASMALREKKSPKVPSA